LRVTTQVSGARIFLDSLLAEDAEIAFGMPGTHILPIVELLEENTRLRFINVRHEASAAAMADAYGRLTNKPGFCLVTAGPGATNSLTGIAHAYSAGSPLVHVSGTVPTKSGLGTFHGVDDPTFLEKTFAPVTKLSRTVNSVAEIPAAVHECFEKARSGRRGPVHLSLPLNILTALGKSSKRKTTKKRVQVNPDLSRAKRIIRASQKPLILLGEEARGLRNEIGTFAETLRAPVISTMNALGAYPQTSPMFAGYIEQFWRIHPTALDLLQEADLVVSIGTRFGTPEVRCIDLVSAPDWLFLTEEKLMRQPGTLKATHLTGDIRSNLIGITQGLDSAHSREEWARRASERTRSHSGELGSIVSRNLSVKPIHPALAVQSLSQHLPNESIICSDSGGNEVWVREYLGVRRDCEYLYPGTFGGMGFALPAAIAASLVRPGSRILAVAGDGGLLMSLMELSTLAEQKSNVVMVVLNDSAYGMMWVLQQRKIASLLHPVNFAKVAEGFGIKAWRVNDPSELSDSYAQAFSMSGPALVDVAIDYKQRFPYETIMEDFRRKYPGD